MTTLLAALLLAPLQDADLRAMGRRAAEEAAAQPGGRPEAQKDAKAYNAHGLRLVRAGSGPGAKSCFGQAVALDPGNASAVANLGFVLLRLKETEAARALLAAGAKAHPGCAEIRNNLAHALLAAGRDAEALGELEAAAALQPRHPQIDYARAHLLHKLGRLADARRVLAPIVARYAQHEAARALLEKIDQALPPRAPARPEGPFPGERQLKPGEAAAFVAEMLRRRDELTKETRATHAEILKLWTPQDEARAQAAADRREKRVAALMERAAAGDKAAAAELEPLMEILPTNDAGGVFLGCGLVGSPLPTDGYRESLPGRLEDEAEKELRENKGPGSDEVLQAAGLLGDALSTRLLGAIERAWFAQHLKVCRPAIEAVGAKHRASREAMKEVHAEVERKKKAIEKLKDDEYTKALAEIEENHRKKCARLVLEFRATVARRGNAWKAAVDEHRAELFRASSSALDEHQKACDRARALVGRREPSKEYLEVIGRGVAVLDQLGGGAPRAAVLSCAALQAPDAFGVMPDLYRAYARALLASAPERGVVCAPSGVSWRKEMALVDYSCVFSFDARYPFACSLPAEARYSLREWLEGLGVDVKLIEIDAFGGELSIGLDGTVSIGVGEGLKGAVEFNPFTGKVGIKVGYGYDVAGVGAGAFITLDNEKGLGWVAEVEAGPASVKLAEGTLVALAPQ